MADDQRPEDHVPFLSGDDVEFEVPYPFAQVDRRAAARCSRCGTASTPRPAQELTVIMHHHARHQRHWMVYCREHVPGREWDSGDPSGLAGARGPVCPSCFLQVPAATRWCDDCERFVP